MNFKQLFYILSINSFFISKLLFIFILFLFSYFLVKTSIMNFKFKGYKRFNFFKTTNFFINIIFVILYILIFIFIIFYLRLLRIGYILDLKPKIALILTFYENANYFILIILFLIIINFILIIINILKLIKDYLIIELLKLHIYLSFPLKKNILDSSTYFEFIEWFLQNMSLTILLEYLLRPFILIALLIENTKYEKYFGQYEIYRIQIFLSKYIFNIRYHFLLIFSIIFYDLYYNDYKITILFKFLPFYFVYIIWFNFLTFLTTDNAYHFRSLIKIIYDLYYNKDTVKYLDLEEENRQQLKLFVYLGLKGEDTLYGDDMSSLGFRILHYCRYVLVDYENNVYFNENIKNYITLPKENKINSEFEEKENDETGNYPSVFVFLIVLNIVLCFYGYKLFF